MDAAYVAAYSVHIQQCFYINTCMHVYTCTALVHMLAMAAQLKLKAFALSRFKNHECN